MLNKGGFGPQSCSQPQKRPNLGKNVKNHPKNLTFCTDWEPDSCQTGHQLSTPFLFNDHEAGFWGSDVVSRSQNGSTATRVA